MGYIEGCKERVKEREELKNHLKECPERKNGSSFNSERGSEKDDN